MKKACYLFKNHLFIIYKLFIIYCQVVQRLLDLNETLKSLSYSRLKAIYRPAQTNTSAKIELAHAKQCKFLCVIVLAVTAI